MELYENADRIYARELAEAGRRDMADARKAEATDGLVKVPEHVVVSLPRPLTAKSMSNGWKHGYRTGSKAQHAADIAKVEAVRAVWSAKRTYLDVSNALSACDDILEALRGEK